jgi:hypothetical protein
VCSGNSRHVESTVAVAIRGGQSCRGRSHTLVTGTVPKTCPIGSRPCFRSSGRRRSSASG